MKKTPNGSLKTGTNSVFPEVAKLVTPAKDEFIGQKKEKTKGKNKTISIEKATPKSNGNGQGITFPMEDVLQVNNLLHVLDQVRNGNFSARMPVNGIGINGKVCDTLNEIISLNEIFVQ